MSIRHKICTGLVAMAASALVGAGAATADQSNPPDGTASTPCYSTHNSGSGLNAMNVCFSDHGNVMKFESPAGFEHIRVATLSEGYVLNDTSTGVNYYDYGSTEAGFLAPVIVQPNGANTFPLTINRTTTDGLFRLQQVFSWNTGTKEVKIVMTVFNNTAVQRIVKLTRYFDGDIDNDVDGDFYARTNNAVMAWEDGAATHGLVLTNQASNGLKTTAVRNFSGGTIPVPASIVTPTATTGDYEGYLTTQMTIPGSNNRAATISYRRI